MAEPGRPPAGRRRHPDPQAVLRCAAAVHDLSLAAWTVVAAARARGHGRAGALDAAVVALNLAAGAPYALRRWRARRVDPVALAAPPAVALAVGTALLRPGSRAAVLATVPLHLLNAAERRRARVDQTAAGIRRS